MDKKWMVLLGVVGLMLCVASTAVAEILVYSSPGSTVIDPRTNDWTVNWTGFPDVWDLPDGTYTSQGLPRASVGGIRTDWKIGFDPIVTDWNLFGFVGGDFKVCSYLPTAPFDRTGQLGACYKPWPWTAAAFTSPYNFTTSISVPIVWRMVDFTISDGEITYFSGGYTLGNVNDPQPLWKYLNPHAISFNHNAPGILVLAPPEAQLFVTGTNIAIGGSGIYSEISELWLPDGFYGVECNGVGGPWSGISIEIQGSEIVWSSSSYLLGREQCITSSSCPDPNNYWAQLGERVIGFRGNKTPSQFTSMISNYVEDYGLDLNEKEGNMVISTAGLTAELAQCVVDLDASLNPPCPTLADGCAAAKAYADLQCVEPSDGWSNHGEYVSCVAQAVEFFIGSNYGNCDPALLDDISSCVVNQAARSPIGK